MTVSCHSYSCIDLVPSAHRKPLDVAETHCHNPSWFSHWSAHSFSTYIHLPAFLSSALTLTDLLIGVPLHPIRTNPSMLRLRLWKVRLFAICNLRLGSASGIPSNTCFPCFSDSENYATPFPSVPHPMGPALDVTQCWVPSPRPQQPQGSLTDHVTVHVVIY